MKEHTVNNTPDTFTSAAEQDMSETRQAFLTGERAEFFQRADGENFPFTDANGFGCGFSLVHSKYFRAGDKRAFVCEHNHFLFKPMRRRAGRAARGREGPYHPTGLVRRYGRRYHCFCPTSFRANMAAMPITVIAP